MKHIKSIILLLCLSILGSSNNLHAANQKSFVYEGSLDGSPIIVTIVWSDYGAGSGAVAGTILDQGTGKSYTIKGQEEELPGYLNISIGDRPEIYKLASQQKDGKIIWIEGKGDYLTFSRLVPAAQPGVVSTSPPPAMTLPKSPVTGTTAPSQPGVASTTPPPAMPLPKSPFTGTTAPSQPGAVSTTTPPAMTLPKSPFTGTTAPSQPGVVSTTTPPAMPLAPSTAPVPTLQPGVGRPANVAADEYQVINPIVWPVGRWPEGMALDGKNLWVAESGQRTLARLNVDTGEVIGRVNAGEMPVGMVSNVGKGTVFAADVEDRTVFKYSNSGAGGAFASMRGFFLDIVADDVAVWVLSDNGKVIRYDQESGASTTAKVDGSVGKFEVDYGGLAKSGKYLFATEIFDDLSVINYLDAESLEYDSDIEIEGYYPSVAVNNASIFAAGGTPEVEGEIIQFDIETGNEIANYIIEDEYIELVVADSNFVVAVGEYGDLWLFSAKDLTILRSIELGDEDFLPTSVLIHGESILISTHMGSGENGSILVLRDFLRGQVR